MKLKIKGRSYKVNFKQGLCVEGDKVNGCVDYLQSLISIEKDRDPIEMISTIAHELYHAYFRECGLIDLSFDEGLIDWLGSQYFDIFISFINILVRLDKVFGKDLYRYSCYKSLMKKIKGVIDRVY